MMFFFILSTNCNCCNLLIPDARSELNALLCLKTTSVTRGGSALCGDADDDVSSSNSAVSMRAESVTVGCFDSVLTERLLNLKSKFCIVAEIENYASKKRADVGTFKMKCVFPDSSRLRLTTIASTL
jgi:hypothetical protein